MIFAYLIDGPPAITHAPHIWDACQDAARTANLYNYPVGFVFNGVFLRIEPGQAPERIRERYDFEYERQYLCNHLYY